VLIRGIPRSHESSKSSNVKRLVKEENVRESTELGKYRVADKRVVFLRSTELLGSWVGRFDFRCGLESVNALPKVVGFLRVFWFPPTGNVDRVGWD
jgi:hypothetical protein